MMDKIYFNIYKKSFLYFTIYGGIIFIIILAGIFPLYLNNSNQVKENEKLKYQIKEQKELGPLYTTLNAMKGKDLLVFPNPEKTALPRSGAGKFQDEFQIIAKRSGLIVVSFTQDLNTLTGPSTSLLHNVVLKGEFADFRKMLIGLGAVPYLDRIEEISIQQGAKFTDFKMKVWIAIK